MDRPDYTLPAVSWIAHMPETMLYVDEKNVPDETAQALHKRKGKANIYIIGPEKVVSRAVEDEPRQYGKVTRISGDDPFENAVQFAQFNDPVTGFGWGVQSPGYSLVLDTRVPVLSIALHCPIWASMPLYCLRSATGATPLRSMLNRSAVKVRVQGMLRTITPGSLETNRL